MAKELMTNQEHVEMVKQYQQTGDDFIFSDIFTEVQQVVEGVAYKEWNKSQGQNMSKDEFLTVAYEGLLKAVNNFNGDKGSNFVSFVKQNVKWAISDNIYKAMDTKKENFHKDILSLDYKLGGSDDGTFMDAVEHNVSTNLSDAEYQGNTSADSVDDVFNAVADKEVEENNPVDELRDVIKEYKSTSSEVDAQIIDSVVSIIMSVDNPTPKVVNKELQSLITDVKPATLRKKKSRALNKFTEFAQEKGYSFDLSQF